MADDPAEPGKATAEELKGSKRRGRTLISHILDGEPWPDDLAESINQRSRDTGRDIEFELSG
jgi:hypothetical protein